MGPDRRQDWRHKGQQKLHAATSCPPPLLLLSCRCHGPRRQSRSVLSSSCPGPLQSPAEEQSATTITLVYETSWPQAFLQYRRADGTWTELPGVLMGESQIVPGCREALIEATATEFAISNGKGSWDNPNPPKQLNYVIDEPGVYQLSNGVLTRL